MKKVNKHKDDWDISDRRFGLIILCMIILSLLAFIYACIMPDEKAIQIENSIIAEEKRAESANISDENTKYIIREVIYDADEYCVSSGNIYTFSTFESSEAIDIYSKISNSNGYKLLQYDSQYRGFWDGRTEYTILFEKTF